MTASAIYSLPIQDFVAAQAWTVANNHEIQLPIAIQQGDRSRVLFEIMAVELDLAYAYNGTAITEGEDVQFNFGIYTKPLVALADGQINDPYTLVWHHKVVNSALTSAATANGPPQFWGLGDFPVTLDLTMDGMKQGVLVAVDKIYMNANLYGLGITGAEVHVKIWYRLRKADLMQYTRLMLQQAGQA